MAGNATGRPGLKPRLTPPAHGLKKPLLRAGAGLLK